MAEAVLADPGPGPDRSCPGRASGSAAALSVLPAASRHSATAPVTCGVAMLVPDLRTSRPGLWLSTIDADRAASTSTPGATRSGLGRRSRLGPLLLNGATGRAGS